MPSFFVLRSRISKTPHVRSSEPKIEEPATFYIRSSKPKIKEPTIFGLRSRIMGRRSDRRSGAQRLSLPKNERSLSILTFRNEKRRTPHFFIFSTRRIDEEPSWWVLRPIFYLTDWYEDRDRPTTRRMLVSRAEYYFGVPFSHAALRCRDVRIESICT